jgi:hypothetical protein
MMTRIRPGRALYQRQRLQKPWTDDRGPSQELPLVARAVAPGSRAREAALNTNQQTSRGAMEMAEHRSETRKEKHVGKHVTSLIR